MKESQYFPQKSTEKSIEIEPQQRIDEIIREADDRIREYWKKHWEQRAMSVGLPPDSSFYEVIIREHDQYALQAKELAWKRIQEAGKKVGLNISEPEETSDEILSELAKRILPEDAEKLKTLFWIPRGDVKELEEKFKYYRDYCCRGEVYFSDEQRKRRFELLHKWEQGLLTIEELQECQKIIFNSEFSPQTINLLERIKAGDKNIVLVQTDKIGYINISPAGPEKVLIAAGLAGCNVLLFVFEENNGTRHAIMLHYALYISGLLLPYIQKILDELNFRNATKKLVINLTPGNYTSKNVSRGFVPSTLKEFLSKYNLESKILFRYLIPLKSLLIEEYLLFMFHQHQKRNYIA
jgi:hypothetical protein